MKPGLRRLSLAAAVSALVAFAGPALSQDIPESHVKAARAAIAAIRATDAFDGILQQTAQSLRQQLIQQNPDLQDAIIDAVNKRTIELASRRSDLEREAALAYARVFSEAELNAIAEFYKGEAGKKLLDSGPIVTREVVKAAGIWRNGVTRDLGDAVSKDLQVAAAGRPKPPAAPQAAAPAKGAAPAKAAPAKAAAPAKSAAPAEDAAPALDFTPPQ